MDKLSAVKAGKKVLELVGGAAVIVAACFASVAGISPFGTAAFIALIFCGLPVYIAFPAYAAGMLALDFHISSLVFFAVGAVAGVGAKLIMRVKKMKNVSPVIFGLLAQSGVVAAAFAGSGLNPLKLGVSLVLGLGFMYLCMTGLKPILVSKLRFKLFEVELVCLGTMLCVCALGLSCLPFDFPVVAIVGSFVILLALSLKGAGAGLASSLCFGVGCALSGQNPIIVGAFAFMALVSAVFAAAPKILFSLSGVLGFTMFAYYFSDSFYKIHFWVIAFSAGAIIFALLPGKAISAIRQYFFSSHSREAARHMVNRAKQDLGTSLLKSGEIFSQMSAHMACEKQAVFAHGGILKKEMCFKCDRCEYCLSQPGFEQSLDLTMQSVLEKGRASVSMLPAVLTSCCNQLAPLLAKSAECAQLSRESEVKIESDNSARRIISAQLSGMAGLMQKMGSQALQPLSYAIDAERYIADELSYSGVIVSEVIASAENITIVARTESVDVKVIEKVVKRITKLSYCAANVDDTVVAGFSVVTLERSPRLEIVFGVAGCPKTDAPSGDTHSFIKLNRHKLMLALCDGMGSGKKARTLSEAALGLIESFYKAGFESELVLSSVNKFLSLDNDDSFSALDICVVDLDSGDMDLIKFGAPPTYIKKGEFVMRVDGESLPLGSLDTIKPSITAHKLAGGEAIVLVSDGISDSFKGDGLSAVVNNNGALNPQSFAENVLKSALESSGGAPKDDCTVICARVIPRQ